MAKDGSRLNTQCFQAQGRTVGREAKKGKQKGRTLEIERLIGRALRAVCDMKMLGEREVTVDCDVLPDGGTRTASICGGYVALHDAFSRLVDDRHHNRPPVNRLLCCDFRRDCRRELCLDLPYEDSGAEVDMNVVMTGSGKFVEVQGTAEGDPFDSDQLQGLLELATSGISQIVDLQRTVLAENSG